MDCYKILIDKKDDGEPIVAVAIMDLKGKCKAVCTFKEHEANHILKLFNELKMAVINRKVIC